MQVVPATASVMGLRFEDTTLAIGLFVSAGETGATADRAALDAPRVDPDDEASSSRDAEVGVGHRGCRNAFFDATGKLKILD